MHEEYAAVGQMVWAGGAVLCAICLVSDLRHAESRKLGGLRVFAMDVWDVFPFTLEGVS